MSASTLRMTYKMGTRDGRGNFKTKWARPRLLRRLEAIVSVEILLGRAGYPLQTEGQCPITKVQELPAGRAIAARLVVVNNEKTAPGLIALAVHGVVRVDLDRAF